MSAPIVWTEHARSEMKRRGIAQTEAQAVLDRPDQEVPGKGGTTVRQSKATKHGRDGLLRVFLAESKGGGGRVVTVYWTSKVTKYWRKAR